MPLVVAHIARSIPEAHVTVSAFEAAGVPAFAFDITTIGNTPYNDTALGGIRIMVSDTGLEAAQTLLAERLPDTLETETEALRRDMSRGLLGLFASFAVTWLPWWTRSRRFRDEPSDARPD